MITEILNIAILSNKCDIIKYHNIIEYHDICNISHNIHYPTVVTASSAFYFHRKMYTELLSWLQDLDIYAAFQYTYIVDWVTKKNARSQNLATFQQ